MNGTRKKEEKKQNIFVIKSVGKKTKFPGCDMCLLVSRKKKNT
jgi:hypothetical protein